MTIEPLLNFHNETVIASEAGPGADEMFSILAIAIGLVLVLPQWCFLGRIVKFASTSDELLDLFTDRMTMRFTKGWAT